MTNKRKPPFLKINFGSDFTRKQKEHVSRVLRKSFEADRYGYIHVDFWDIHEQFQVVSVSKYDALNCLSVFVIKKG